MRRTLDGVVLTIKNKYLTVKTEFGKVCTVKIKHCTLSKGDKVHVIFDYTKDCIVKLLRIGEMTVDKHAIEPAQIEKLPLLEDTSPLDIEEFLGDRGLMDSEKDWSRSFSGTEE